jgi:hypothetical protein
MMSTEPLLPSYGWATQRTGIATPTVSVIQTWSLVIFANAAIFLTVRASKGDGISDWVSCNDSLFRPAVIGSDRISTYLYRIHNLHHPSYHISQPYRPFSHSVAGLAICFSSSMMLLAALGSCGELS